jgi:hypothetical protein
MNGAEPQYNYVKPRFFIEERINDKYLPELLNYKFRFAYGKIMPLISVSMGLKKNVYDLDWKLCSPPELPFNIPKPTNLAKMISLARTLAKPFEFVRIDLYLCKDDKIYFGEYTFSPNRGHKFFTFAQEKLLSQYWPKF